MKDIVKKVATAGLVLGMVGAANALTVSDAQADGLVTACAAAGKVLDRQTGNQCITAKVRFERGGYNSADIGNVQIRKRISDATGRPSWQDAFNTGASMAAAFLTEGKKYGVVYTHFEMGTRASGGACTGSWAQYCGSAGISENYGSAVRGFHQDNRVGSGLFGNAINNMWTRIASQGSASNNNQQQGQVVTRGTTKQQTPVQGGAITSTQTCTVDRKTGCFHVNINIR